MPTISELVDVEALLVAHCEQDPDLGAIVGGTGNAARVSTRLPADFTPSGRLQLFRTGGLPVDGGTEHIDRAVIQAIAYGATKQEAQQVASAAVVALKRAERAAHALGAVSAVERLTGPSWAPDPVTTPETPRYLLSVAVTAHPHPAG